MSQQIVPSRLHLAKVFESVTAYTREDGGLKLVRTDPSLEDQINQWVKATRNLLVSAGDVSWLPRPDTPDGQVIEHRAIAMLYVPAVEKTNAKPYGSDQIAKLQPERQIIVTAAPTGASTEKADQPGASGSSDRRADSVSASESGAGEVGNDERRRLRVPDVIPTSLP